MEPDKNDGQGGSYVIQDGKRVLVERTQDAPMGNDSRPAEAPAPVVMPEQAPAAPADPAPEQPATETPYKFGKGAPQATAEGAK